MSALEETIAGLKYDADGLIPAVCVDHKTGKVLMLAYMNAEALEKTLSTGRAHYWSRSREKLWRKGEQSGHVQKVIEILTDCDQDCLILKVQVDAGQCHVGYKSCFYRRVRPGSQDKLEFIAEPVYDPHKVYDK